MAALLRSFVDIAFVKGLGFTKIEKLLGDFAIWPQGFNVMEEFFLDRRVIKAWKGLADRPMWIRMNTDLLNKLAGKEEAFIKKVNDFYASTSHKLPPGWKNDATLNLPKTYLGVEFNKFGFPKLEPHVSDKNHVVKINMDGSNND